MKVSAGLAHHDISLENICFLNKHQEDVTIIDLGMCLRVPPPVTDRGSGTTTNSRVLLTPRPCRGKPAYVVSLFFHARFSSIMSFSGSQTFIPLCFQSAMGITAKLIPVC